MIRCTSSNKLTRGKNQWVHQNLDNPIKWTHFGTGLSIGQLSLHPGVSRGSIALTRLFKTLKIVCVYGGLRRHVYVAQEGPLVIRPIGILSNLTRLIQYPLIVFPHYYMWGEVVLYSLSVYEQSLALPPSYTRVSYTDIFYFRWYSINDYYR